jgi:hypothetical protein
MEAFARLAQPVGKAIAVWHTGVANPVRQTGTQTDTCASLAFGLLAIAYPTGCRYSTVPIPRNVPVGQQWRKGLCEDADEIAQKPGRRAFAAVFMPPPLFERFRPLMFPSD